MTNSSIHESGSIVLRGQLITRQLARMHRNRVENALERQASVVVDLSQVELMTPSFADECFGTLAEEFGANEFKRKIRLKGPGSEVKHLLKVVISHRLAGRKVV